MNRLIAFFAKQGTFVNIITLAVFLAGIYALVKIRREVFPNINFDVVTVTTIYPGGAAESCERLITNPLEQDLREVDGIKKMTSVSVENSSIIVLQLDPDQVSAEEAEADIQDVVDNFQSELPEGAEDTIVELLESGLRPTITVSLGGDVEEEVLRKAAKRLERDIENISEVARVEFEGVRDFEVKIEANPEKLQSNRLGLQDLVSALQRQNISIPGGVLEASGPEDKEMIVRTVGEFNNAEDVGETVVKANALGRAIRVKDVADIKMGFAKEKVRYRTNGKPSINLTVLKKEKADAIDMVDKVKKLMEEVKPTLAEGINVALINDTSYFVRRRINVLSNNLLVGLALVLVTLSLVLPWRIAAITAFGIPFSFLGAIALFLWMGISINLISLMGLIIVVGMLVDDAIVITENAQAEMEKGRSPEAAAVIGTQQIWAPVTAAVLTTVAAFAPLMMMSGIFGKFIKFIPIGVILSLLVSLFEGFFILPHHVSAWVKSKENQKGTAHGGLMGKMWSKYLTPAYGATVKQLLKVRYGVVFFALVLCAGSVMLVIKKMDFILFPPGAIDTFFIKVDGPVGYSLEQTQQLMLPYEEYVSKLPPNELLDFDTTIGLQSGGGGDPANRKRGSEYGQIMVSLSAETERDRDALEIIEDIKSAVPQPAGAKRVVFERQRGGPPVGKAVSIGVRGAEYNTIMAAVEAVKARLVELPGVSDIEDSYLPGKEEIRMEVDPVEASAAGLSVRDIGTAVRAAYEGVVPTSIRNLEEEIDVRVTLASKYRASADTISKLQIPNARGNLIPLPRVAEWNKTRGIAVYEHENNQRQVSVTAEIDTKVSTSQRANSTMAKIIKEEIGPAHPDVTFHFGGEASDTKESMQTLAEAFGFAFFGILMLMILLFRNIYQPLVIATTIPLGIVAVIWTFYFHDMPLTFLSMIGTIALAGVVVNNAIVFVDFFNRALAGGMAPRDAIVDAATKRLRPITLTTVTTTVGILPTAYGIGGLDPFVVPIALALGWGMLFGSVLTTLFFPPFLAVTEDCIGLTRQMFGWMRRSAP